MTTCAEMIAYLQQFDPNSTVWMLGRDRAQEMADAKRRAGVPVEHPTATG
jgi:hypothetical protein